MDMINQNRKKESWGGKYMYEICYQDICALRIDISTGRVEIANEKYVPFGAFPEESDDPDDRSNNLVDFKSWCLGRILPLDRRYAGEVMRSFGYMDPHEGECVGLAIKNHCLSLDDCFWVKEQDDPAVWDDISLFQKTPYDKVLEPALNGRASSHAGRLPSPDIATDGKAAKAWQRRPDGFYLLKGDHDGSVRKEVEASQILQKLGLPCVEYRYDTFAGEPVSRCRCFTSEQENFVRAQWYAIWCMNHDTDIADMICRYRDQFDRMNLADYLVGNSDEHPENWGFLYDGDRNILGLNPLMDFDHAFEGTPFMPCGPILMLGTHTTQEDCAKDIMSRHPDWLDFGADLSGFYYGDFVRERLDTLREYLKEKEPSGPDLS
jgi:hypothetical protein